MSPLQLQQYLHDHIPLSKAMATSVVTINEHTVVLHAPLAPNINHRATVFGGSASTLAILAAWSLLHTRLHNAGMTSRVVIQRNTMEYTRPIAGEFTAHATLAQPDQWQHFMRMLTRKGKARISVVAELQHAGHVAGNFSGEFVALA